jgi:hypothetical protein
VPGRSWSTGAHPGRPALVARARGVQLGDEQEQHDDLQAGGEIAVGAALERDEPPDRVTRAEQASSLPQLIPRPSPFHPRSILLAPKVHP